MSILDIIASQSQFLFWSFLESDSLSYFLQDLYTDSEREDELLFAEETDKARNTINDFWKTKAGYNKG